MSATAYPPVPGLLKTPSYSHVAIVSGGRTICLAGQVPADAQGRLVGGVAALASPDWLIEIEAGAVVG
jgi:enamine deaminase RidA (YjgF/YER057c/UK114 family)